MRLSAGDTAMLHRSKLPPLLLTSSKSDGTETRILRSRRADARGVDPQRAEA